MKIMKKMLYLSMIGALIISTQVPKTKAEIIETTTELLLADGRIRNGSDVDTSAAVVVINLNSQNDDRGVFEFPLGSIPQASTIVSAELDLFVGQGGGPSGTTGTYQVFGYTGDGLVTTSDFNRTAIMLEEFDHEVGVFGSRIFDVSAFVQDQVDFRSSTSGFLFKAISNDLLVGFRSLETSFLSSKPSLHIDFVAPIFFDGFESGDTAAWSSVVGE